MGRRVGLWLAVALGAIAMAAEASTPVLPKDARAAEVRAYLRALDGQLYTEFEHRFGTDAVEVTSVRAPERGRAQELLRQVAEVPPEYFAELCRAAAGARSMVFAQLVADVLTDAARPALRAEDRAVALKYLKDVPKLILVLERMKWVDLKEPAFEAAWRKVRGMTNRDGTLHVTAYRFAAILASHGHRDALVAFAESALARARTGASVERDPTLRTEIEVLRALVPQAPEGIAAAEFVRVKGKRLVFDAEAGRFR